MPVEVSNRQRVALDVIYEPFRDGKGWPQQRYVEKTLRRHDLVLDSIFERLPPGLIAPDPAYTHFFVRPDDPIALTIAGMSACAGSDRDIDLFLRALQFFVALEDSYSPPPTDGKPLYAGTAELVNHLGLTEADAERVYHLTRHEIRLLGDGGGRPENWQFELTPDIQRFAGVTTIDAYLEKRIVPQPYRRAAVDPQGLFSPSPFSPQATIVPEPVGYLGSPSASGGRSVRWRRLTLLNRVIEYPLISGILATVIAGVILALILGH